MDERVKNDKAFCAWLQTQGIDPEDMRDITRSELDDLYSYYWAERKSL